MFLTENDLRETFWENYNYSGRALRYQFECPIREGCADLLTVERYQGNIQLNAFEFKLSDVKKAILQAQANSDFVNKSWIVIPSEKARLIQTKYLNHLQTIKYVGVIAVEQGGKWSMIHRPFFREDVRMCQTVLNMLLPEGAEKSR